ncbi:MAG: CCA tRNA nucleotidyltransferase [Cyanobacteriota bacterium]
MALDPATASERLWQTLQPGRWPLAPNRFPPGTALVGGAVRDGLLGRLGDTPDLDFVVDGDAIARCRRLQQQHGGACVVLDAGRSIARLVLRGWSLDLARMEPGGLLQDLARRDYTINAMALPLPAGQPLVDPHGALIHLAAGELMAISEANLVDDPLRLLRGVRLASDLGMRLNASSLRWIAWHRKQLVNVAPERVLAELWKLATSPCGHEGLALALTLGLLNPWLATEATHPAAALLALLSPERAGAMGLTATEQERALPLARLSALLRPEALERLRASRTLQQRCARLRPWQQRLPLAGEGRSPGETLEPPKPDDGDPEQLPEPERLALHRSLEEDLPALLLQAPRALARRWLERWREVDDPLFHPRPPLNGAELQQSLALKPSPRLGALLDHLTRERAFGRISTHDEALDQARRWLAATAQDNRL